MPEALAPYQPSPLKNETTGQYVYQGSHRITRSVLHRILKAHGVQHHPGGTFEQLLSVCEMHNIPIQPVPPGLIVNRHTGQLVEGSGGMPVERRDPESEPRADVKQITKDDGSVVEVIEIDGKVFECQGVTAPSVPEAAAEPSVPYAEDGFPKNHGQLKKMAKAYGLKTYNTDKRKDIVKRIKEAVAHA